MTISLNTVMADGKPLLQVDNNDGFPAARWSQLHMDIINSSPSLLIRYQGAAAANVPYVIGGPGGILYQPAGHPQLNEAMYVEPGFFRTGPTAFDAFSNALYIVIEGAHEAAHVADQRTGQLARAEDYATPGDYSRARGINEARAVATEALADFDCRARALSSMIKHSRCNPTLIWSAAMQRECLTRSCKISTLTLRSLPQKNMLAR